jgi:GAF domain-containing protein
MAEDVEALLISAKDRLQSASTLEAVQEIVRTSARKLVDAHGATLVLRDGDLVYYADEDSMSPLWRGQRFPIGECISGWTMVHRESVVIPDIRTDDRIPQSAYRPTFVRSLIMVPIRIEDPLGAIGAYWASMRRASGGEVELLSQLAAAAGGAIEYVVRTAPSLPWAPTLSS